MTESITRDAGVVNAQAAAPPPPSSPYLTHDAQDDAEPMSRPESPNHPFQGTHRLTDSNRSSPVQDEQFKRQSLSTPDPLKIRHAEPPSSSLSNLPTRELPFAHMRMHFQDFALQLRQHRHHEHRKHMLSHRRRHYEKAIALSARLHRVCSWVRGGLVEISTNNEAAGFAHVRQRMQDLVDSCSSQWSHEIQALDMFDSIKFSQTPSFFTKLPESSQKDCIELLETLRRKPQFLVDRFKAMDPAQIKGLALSATPKYHKISDSVLSSLPQNRGRTPRAMRITAYSKQLEEYASSFERSNPLPFLLHNVYGPSDDVRSREGRLRIATWSTVCARLMTESEHIYEPIFGRVLSTFASLYDWQIKERLELLLMRILQEGALFLDGTHFSSQENKVDFGNDDGLNTQAARDFLDDAVRSIFQLLAMEEGIPIGALELGRAIISKLPSEKARLRFRGDFLNRWFLRDFLHIAIVYPEDEGMLLQVHISEKSRNHLLQRLYEHAFNRANDIYNPIRLQPIDPAVHYYFDKLIDNLSVYGVYTDPYEAEGLSDSTLPTTTSSSLSICATDISHLLEGLSPQFIHTSSPWDSFLSSSHSTFRSQYHQSGATGKFEKLLRAILNVIEPGQSSKNVHVCEENWAIFDISTDGRLAILNPLANTNPQSTTELFGNLNAVEHATIRLADVELDARNSSFTSSNINWSSSNLSEMFLNQRKAAQIKADGVASLYWHTAYMSLKSQYPLTVFTADDTKVLSPLIATLTSSQIGLESTCSRLDNELTNLSITYAAAKAKISQVVTQVDKLRIKLWYTMSVLTSDVYDGARNVSVALNNMTLSPYTTNLMDQYQRSPYQFSRPSTSSTSVSSHFDQPRIDTMTILKAPKEYGGPRKLSDQQIEMTKKWLKRVENFCKGEERIHRFCMEVKTAMRKLVGETMTDSPILWSSELFVREKNLYEAHSSNFFSPLPSTRAPSVMSEPLSSSSFPTRFGTPGSRGSFYSQSSSRTGRHSLGSDLSSLISSVGRAPTVTTTDSHQFWSSPPSNPRSNTSISSRSYPASTFEGRGLDHGPEKAKFLADLQQDLISLLLSDLGCLVWSMGSETDSWMNMVRTTPGLTDRLRRRNVRALLHARNDVSPKTEHKRRRSYSANAKISDFTEIDHIKEALCHDGEVGDETNFTFRNAFEDVLARISHHVDPGMKLKAVVDFANLAQSFRRTLPELKSPKIDPTSNRRSSLNPSVLTTKLGRLDKQSSKGLNEVNSGTIEEAESVNILKQIMFTLAPKTIFRDLQYISAFVASTTLEATEMARSFLRVGLAALAWKDDVCRGMVDLADGIVGKDSSNGSKALNKIEGSMVNAAELWMIAAREGNAIAQRELAILYLTHSEDMAIVSLPWALASDVFKPNMVWQEEEQPRSRYSRQALSLALHWMQAAADNGDIVAQEKLEERRASRSIQ